MSEARAHWDDVWRGADPAAKSWFQVDAQPSLDLVLRHTPSDGRVIDVGGGASPLVDGLLDAGLLRPTVVDVAGASMAVAGRRLAQRAAAVEWVVADVRDLDLGATFDTWHDRAVLHFLTDTADQAAYLAVVARHVRPGGHVVVATFASDGPTHCSGLVVQRYDVDDLVALFGDGYDLVESARVEHRTPSDALQPFTFVVLRRHTDRG